MSTELSTLVRSTIEHHSKSFALASKLLPADARADAHVLYAFCRHVDDAVDEVPPWQQPARLTALRAQVDAIYADGAQPIDDPVMAAMRRVVRARGIPRTYCDELIAGMEMDVRGQRYERLDQLLRYCYRVAGTVGLMMCHVMGVRTQAALTHAAHLGIAMQLTNIARDVMEDWQRGRLYLPAELLRRHGADNLDALLGGALPEAAVPALAGATAELLTHADGYYASGDAGLPHLSLRCAFGVLAARLIYARIGDVVRRRGCDPRAGRAIVPKATKLWLALGAGLRTLLRIPRALRRPRPAIPSGHLEDPTPLLLLPGG